MCKNCGKFEKSSKPIDTPLALFFAEKCLEAAVEEGAVLVVLVDKDEKKDE